MEFDYVGIFYSHRVDPRTPLEETIGALDHVVRQGKALYAGISSYSPDMTRQAAAILRGLGTPCLIHQPSYSMLNRWIDGGLLDVLGELGADRRAHRGTARRFAERSRQHRIHRRGTGRDRPSRHRRRRQRLARLLDRHGAGRTVTFSPFARPTGGATARMRRTGPSLRSCSRGGGVQQRGRSRTGDQSSSCNRHYPLLAWLA